MVTKLFHLCFASSLSPPDFIIVGSVHGISLPIHKTIDNVKVTMKHRSGKGKMSVCVWECVYVCMYVHVYASGCESIQAYVGLYERWSLCMNV